MEVWNSAGTLRDAYTYLHLWTFILQHRLHLLIEQQGRKNHERLSQVVIVSINKIRYSTLSCALVLVLAAQKTGAYADRLQSKIILL